jgi:hypothetical protein
MEEVQFQWKISLCFFSQPEILKTWENPGNTVNQELQTGESINQSNH